MEPEAMPLPWLKVIFQHDTPLLENVENYFHTHFNDFYEIIFSNSYLLELTAKGADKGSSVLRVAKLMGIEQSHIYCAGDNQNDLPMLRISAIPFAPANASEKVKTSGARIVSSCDDNCIVDIINILDKIY
jgi:hydroxymethylpyrimidine pyrophosphatase-like HAD family hydrolase